MNRHERPNKKKMLGIAQAQSESVQVETYRFQSLLFAEFVSDESGGG